jgi:hypothetical protein
VLEEVRLRYVCSHPSFADIFPRLARFTTLYAQPPSGVVAHEEMSSDNYVLKVLGSVESS